MIPAALQAAAPPVDHTFCVAPMMDWTDRHERYLLRLLSRRALLYTEMVTARALLHGDAARLLAFDPREQPLALQLGGNEPRLMARAARLAAEHGFVEVNINLGCPSDRVRRGSFGACLMREPALVAECVDAMRQAGPLPVTLKTRIGIDDDAPGPRLWALVERASAAGCRTFVVHARNAWLQGLSPKENREVPPLHYALVHRLKAEHPQLEIVLNGGLQTLEACGEQLRRVDGVMLGRAAYHNPYLLAEVDRRLFGAATPAPSRHAVVEAYLPYVERQLAAGQPLTRMTRHLLGLFHGCRGGRRWRRLLSERAHRPGAGVEVIESALAAVPRP